MRFGKLEAALEGLGETSGRLAEKVRADAASVLESVFQLEAATSRAESASRQSLERVRGEAASAAEQVEATSSRIERRLEQARDSALQQKSEIDAILDEMLNSSASKLDDLRHAVEQAASDGQLFADELLKQLDALEIGATTLDDILRKFADADVNGKKVRDLLAGIDPRKLENDLQQIQKLLREGALEVDGLLKFLNERGGEFGKTVAGWVDALQKQEITLGRFKDLIEGLQSQFEGTDFADLLDSIEDSVDRGLI